MLNFRPIIILLCCLLTHSTIYADPQTQTQTQTQAQLAQIRNLKAQLYNDLNNADIASAIFDDKTEMEIARTQMAIGVYYLSQNDRKYAIICAIIARRIMQRIYGNVYDPRLIPIYSLLVQAYDSSVDIDNPNVDSSDAAKAKMYREMIDHIHAQ